MSHEFPANITCPICLTQPPDDLTVLDGCFHKFCFVCILQWGEMQRTCPICKARFTKLVHKIHPTIPSIFEVFHFENTTAPSTNEHNTSSVAHRNTQLRRAFREQVYKGMLVPKDTQVNEKKIPFGPCAKINFPKPNDLDYYQKNWRNKLARWLSVEAPIFLHHGVITSTAEQQEECNIVTAIIQALVFKYGDVRQSSQEDLAPLCRLVGDTCTQVVLSELTRFLTSPYSTPNEYDDKTEYITPSGQVITLTKFVRDNTPTVDLTAASSESSENSSDRSYSSDQDIVDLTMYSSSDDDDDEKEVVSIESS